MEALRVLRTTRKTAVKSRRAALQQLHNTVVAAPDEVRDRIRDLTRMRRLRTCAAWRPDATRYRDPEVATRLSLKSLTRRILALDEEIAALDRHIAPLVEELALDLLALEGVGVARRWRADGRGGRESRPAALRGELRDAVRRLPAARIEREDAAPSPQSWGEPPSKLGPPHDRRVPHAHRPANPRLRRAAHAGGAVQTRGHALPEALVGTRLQQFLLELGKGFLFEARQERFSFDDSHFFVDLVSYNRLLRCYVLIDLKAGKLTHQGLGQMQMCVNYFDRYVRIGDELPDHRDTALRCEERRRGRVDAARRRQHLRVEVPTVPAVEGGTRGAGGEGSAGDWGKLEGGRSERRARSRR